MKVSSIFSETYKELIYGTRRIIHQGGQWSGKTVNILTALATLASEETDGSVTTVTSMSFPHLKGGALRDFEMYVQPAFKNSISKYHKTDHLFTFKSGAMIEFKVFETEMDARGQKRKRLFINEANSFNYLVYFQLDSRSEQTIIDYNPSIRFWAHEKLINFPGNVSLISDHRHNPFLTEEKHAEIEAHCTFNEEGLAMVAKNLIPPKSMAIGGDYELWKVYARGLTGNVRGVIFPYWEMIDDSDYPEDDGSEVYGIDFGYTNDPTAIIKIHHVAGTLFVKELAYEPGMPVRHIKMILDANGFDENESVIFCEHDPDMIREMRNAGIYNAHPARKGPGSIKAGIELLNQFKVKYTCSSKNLHRERSLYIWMPDKENGEPTNIPTDKNNHTFDATRYAAYTRWLKTGEM